MGFSEVAYKFYAAYKSGGMELYMSYVDPKIKMQFESLSVELKNAILEKNVQLHNLNDLIKVLEDISNEPQK